MKNAEILPNDQFSEMQSLETSTQFVIRPLHIVFTFMLLAAWVWLGTAILG